jgi:hypothetical protein
MTFVQRIITDEDRQSFDFSNITCPRLIGPVNPRTWIVDDEQGVVLIPTAAGLPEDYETKWFKLYWKGEKFDILVRKSMSKVPDREHFNIHWDLVDLDMKVERSTSRAEVMRVLRDALASIGPFGTLTEPGQTYVATFGF